MPRRGVAGFSLIELMIALAILSVLLGVATPAFNGMVASQRVKTAAVDLHTSLLQARAEAVKRNRTLRLRPPSGGDWGDGWLVPNPDTPSSDANPLIPLQSVEGVSVTSDATYFDFRAMGRVESNGSVNADGNYILQIASSGDSSKKRCMVIGLAGRAKSESCVDEEDE